jgi:26S proteasome regulatory subunit N6
LQRSLWIRPYLAALYNTPLEKNSLKIAEPYSMVDVADIAECARQEVQSVEVK